MKFYSQVPAYAFSLVWLTGCFSSIPVKDESTDPKESIERHTEESLEQHTEETRSERDAADLVDSDEYHIKETSSESESATRIPEIHRPVAETCDSERLVSESEVQATLAYLPKVVADMVRFQRPPSG